MGRRKSMIFPYIWKYKLSYVLGLLTLLVVDYVNLYIPQITGEITDGLTSYQLNLSGVIQLLMRLMIFVIIITIGRVLWRFFIFGASRKIETEIRNDMFSKLELLSQNYYHQHKTGDLMTHFTNDLEALRIAIGPAVISSFDATIMTALVLYKMVVHVNLRLTLLTLIPMSLIAIGGYFFGEEFERRFALKQNAFAKLSDRIQESITGERVIKGFVQEEKQDQSFDKMNTYNKEKNMGVVQLMATVMPLLDFVIGLAYVICIIYGGYLTIIGEVSLGRFVAFNQYLGMLVWPMIALGDSITSFSQGRAAIGRIRQVFQEVPEIQDEDVKDIHELYGEIMIQNVSFQYQDQLPFVLKNIQLHIQKGETLVVLGRTGSGKTTLINLLLHLYQLKEGCIVFDQYPIEDIPLYTLRGQIAYVPQDNYLFSDTIENNIAFGKKDATHEEIVKACRVACVHDNIIDFPMGYQTIVGERGVTLSGGQKQRCAIARALLKDSPILIMDDALSAVDTDTESQILENLKLKRQGKTTIMIAHRVSTVKNADHILVLDEGNMVEYGTFEELMNQQGVFKAMYDQQQLEQQLNAI